MGKNLERNEVMKYRKAHCGKVWRSNSDPEVMSGEACTITNIRCDQWLAWRAGLIAEPEWHKAKGNK